MRERAVRGPADKRYYHDKSMKKSRLVVSILLSRLLQTHSIYSYSLFSPPLLDLSTSPRAAAGRLTQRTYIIPCPYY
eukprot:scaffold226467_cov31-Tisochrysis_lutea.AAC.4